MFNIFAHIKNFLSFIFSIVFNIFKKKLSYKGFTYVKTMGDLLFDVVGTDLEKLQVENFNKMFLEYFKNLPDEKKLQLVDRINEENTFIKDVKLTYLPGDKKVGLKSDNFELSVDIDDKELGFIIPFKF